MNKLTTATIGTALLVSTLFMGTAANAAPTTCADIGRTVQMGDPAYLPNLDTDSDGLICESASVKVPIVQGTYPPVAPATQAPSETGQLDSNGNPVKLDSNGNPLKTDEAGKPVQQDNLASTGANGIIIWSVIGGLALAIGLFFLRRAKTQ